MAPESHAELQKEYSERQVVIQVVVDKDGKVSRVAVKRLQIDGSESIAQG
jgi:hypothetical protein